MLRRALRTGFKSASLPNRYYIYGQNGRAIMGNPEPNQPPKLLFQYQYAFDNYPDQFNGFVYRPHDKYVLEQTFAFEVFDYKYEGEQWNIGSLGVNIFYFLVPFLMYVLRKKEHEHAKFIHAAKSTHYSIQGGFLSNSGTLWDEGDF